MQQQLLAVPGSAKISLLLCAGIDSAQTSRASVHAMPWAPGLKRSDPAGIRREEGVLVVCPAYNEMLLLLKSTALHRKVQQAQSKSQSAILT